MNTEKEIWISTFICVDPWFHFPYPGSSQINEYENEGRAMQPVLDGLPLPGPGKDGGNCTKTSSQFFVSRKE
jgi:hypothetical protein